MTSAFTAAPATWPVDASILGMTTDANVVATLNLVDAMIAHYRALGERVGVVAVDPTSPFSGGAILGDRIRMQEHYADPGIYIRSMATRGSLGGLARTTADVATVLDASGRDLILIETVGVGQDEVDIVRLADITIVILVPGMGDRHRSRGLLSQTCEVEARVFPTRARNRAASGRRTALHRWRWRD